MVSDLATGRVEYEMKRPFAGDAGVAFGEPAWSPDDKRLAVLYLQSSGIEEDHDATVILMGIDLAISRSGPILPEPFASYAPREHRLRFSPESDRVMFPRNDPRVPLGVFPHIVGFDGQGLRRAVDVVYLDDGQHMVEDLRRVEEPGRKLMAGSLREVSTGKTVAVSFPASPPVYAWSVDGRWVAQVQIMPYNKEEGHNRSIITAVSTQTGEAHELANWKGAVHPNQLTWVRY